MSLFGTEVGLVFCPNCAVDRGVPLILEEYDKSGRNFDNILILDCGSIVDFELLGLVVPEKYVSKVRYAECFDLEGVFQSIDDMTKDLILIVGLRQMLDRDKLSDFSMTHKQLNDVLLQVRKYQSLDGDVILLENESESASIIDYYVDVRYQVKSGNLSYV